jgi:hypothetical protein
MVKITQENGRRQYIGRGNSTSPFATPSGQRHRLTHLDSGSHVEIFWKGLYNIHSIECRFFMRRGNKLFWIFVKHA